MKITFNTDCELQVCTHIEDDDPVFENYGFKEGEEFDVDEVPWNSNELHISVQFGNGHTTGIPRGWVEIKE